MARNARAGLPHLFRDRPDREGRDRLEILTTLLSGPSFDGTFRSDVIVISRQHPVYAQECVVGCCEETRSAGTDLCATHLRQWKAERDRGLRKAAFLTSATRTASATRADDHLVGDERACRICVHRPPAHLRLDLCRVHLFRWYHHKKVVGALADFGDWLHAQEPLPAYESCVTIACSALADSALGLCIWHHRRYERDDRPGGAALPKRWRQRFEYVGKPVPVAYSDRELFRRWCATAPAQPSPGLIDLRGLRPLVRSELKWGLHIHAQRPQRSRWELGWFRSLVSSCRVQQLDSLAGFRFGEGPSAYHTGLIAREILHELRLIYFTPTDAKEAGFLETDHFGVRFRERASHVDLTMIPQRWLRDLTWDHIAALLQSPQCPRSGGVVDGIRRAAVELGIFLQLDASHAGHDPVRRRPASP